MSDNLPPRIAAELQHGRLEQSCGCGRWEAAGGYCTGCYRSMGPEDWYENGDPNRRAAGRQKAPAEAQTPLYGPPGPPRVHSGGGPPVVTPHAPSLELWPSP